MMNRPNFYVVPQRYNEIFPHSIENWVIMCIFYHLVQKSFALLKNTRFLRENLQQYCIIDLFFKWLLHSKWFEESPSVFQRIFKLIGFERRISTLRFSAVDVKIIKFLNHFSRSSRPLSLYAAANLFKLGKYTKLLIEGIFLLLK